MTSYDICDAWANALLASVEIERFLGDFLPGSELMIQIGYDAAREFGVEDAPYVILQPVEEHRGHDLEMFEYHIAVFMGLDAGKNQPPVYLMENLFCPAVMTCLAGSGYLPHRAEFETGPALSGFVEKNALITHVVPHTLGRGKNIWL